MSMHSRRKSSNLKIGIFLSSLWFRKFILLRVGLRKVVKYH